MSIIVSISCITYNHASYIRECLDSFLIQKTTFPIEVVIHDDCSSDGTREIIEEYATKYPDIIFPMFQTENQYSKGVRGMMSRFNFPRCRGKYIALCEGDDYWTDSNKLQKQVDFLENNNEYTMCFHDATYLYPEGFSKKFSEKYKFLNNQSDFGRSDLLKFQWFIPTASMMFLNFGTAPSYFFKVNAGDYNLQLFLSKLGKFHYLPESMSVYRITGTGMSSLSNNKPLVRINDLKIWFENSSSPDKKHFSRMLFANYRLIFRQKLSNGNYFTLRDDLFKMILALYNYLYYLGLSYFIKSDK